MLEETARLLGKVNAMQRGYTTGTTAQGACKGAAELLVSGIIRERVLVTLPGGLEIPLALEACSLEKTRALCAVRKDPGDDKDITRDMLIFAEACWTDGPGVSLEGGCGVGRVTREGLAVPPGDWAINPVPRRCMMRDLEDICPPGKGIRVTLSIPDGEALAGKTWNPRLGIEGGLSIIGTTGMVEPKSDGAYKASIDVWVNTSYAANPDFLCLTLGYVGEKALARETPPVPVESVVKCGDHVGHTIGYAMEKGFKEIFLIGHIGKLVKMAIGIFNTHWKSGDGRRETLAAHAALLGADHDLIKRLMAVELAEEGASLLTEEGYGEVFSSVAKEIITQIDKRYKGPRYRVALVNLKGDVLGEEKNYV